MKILKNEIENDPLGRGYSGMTDAQVVASLNSVDRTHNKTRLSNVEVLEAIETSALLSLTGDQAARVWGVLGMGTINPHGNAASVFVDAFGANSQTITALKALRGETISRAEELGIKSLSAQIVSNAISGRW